MGSLSYSIVSRWLCHRYILDGISTHRHTNNRAGYTSYDDRMPCKYGALVPPVMQDISMVLPYVVQLRSSFGTTGVRFQGSPEVFRLSCGLDSSHGVGAGAINSASDSVRGFDNLPVVFGLFTLLELASLSSSTESSGLKTSLSDSINNLAYALYVAKTSSP